LTMISVSFANIVGTSLYLCSLTAVTVSLRTTT
jgi:hypothetical protein